MDEPRPRAPARIGRPPKVDADGTPTRERLIRAAVEACVEFGYDGATLADIARRADVSTPAIYTHFSGKAALLVEASKHELDAISARRMQSGEAGVRALAQRWLRDDFARTRALLVELHSAATRHPEVAELLASWQRDNAQHLGPVSGMTMTQVKLYYLVLLGLSHLDAITGIDVEPDELGEQVGALIDAWFAATAEPGDC